MALRDTVRSLTPDLFLKLFRAYKRKQTRLRIQQEFKSGEVLSQADLEKQFSAIGIQLGDDVLVHAAFSKIGAVEGGAEAFIAALRSVVGPSGHILMPSSPNASFQLDFIQNLSCFDVQNEPSKLGYLTEAFRQSSSVMRSAHPTEPVCVQGPDANWYVAGHEDEAAPYGQKSPFFKLTERQGKVLYVGVTLANAGTSLHLLEEAVDNFIFPVYAQETYGVSIKNHQEEKNIRVKVHNPEQSKKRRCDELLPGFESAGIAKQVQLGKANSWLFDAERMLHWMIEQYEEKKVTMYTPHGWPENK